MNKYILLGAAAMVAALPQALDASDYDKYVDWQWSPVVTNDVHADENVRNQMDFTKPVHGPWLTIPSETGMTVTWITRIPCAGGVEYREKGTTNWVERWQVKYGQIDYSREVQSVRLEGLKPATEYEYRLLSNVDHYTTAYHMVLSRGREIYSFRTVDNGRKNYRVFMSADTHGSFRLSLDPMLDRTGGADSDFFFLVGDIVEDGQYNNIRYFTTFGYLDDIVRRWGTSKPTIFIRGNHDIAGIDTYKYGDYFPQPNGKTYYAFRQGPCYFVGIDTMWPPKEALQKRQWEAYLREQNDWLKALKTTPDWKASAFRVVMFHVPLFPGEGMSFPMDFFGETLSDESAAGRVHAVVTGHEHAYARINPNTKETRLRPELEGLQLTGPKAYPPKWFCRNVFPERFPYVSIVLHQNDAMTVDVSSEKLVFKSHQYQKTDGALFDAFEISPDGKVKDLIEMTVVPWAQPEPKAAKKK